MSNPPPIIKLALESVCALLEESTDQWRFVRSAIVRENFITNIISLNAEDIS